eukprot:263105_1
MHDSNMLSFMIFIYSIFTNCNPQNICLWGSRNTENSYIVNGNFIYKGIYNAAPYYTKIIDPNYAPYNITYLWQYTGIYILTNDPPTNTTLPNFRGKCSIPSTDPISCGRNWNIGHNSSIIDMSVFAQNAPCPHWNCDRIVTTDIGNTCDQNFNITIAPNVWSNSAGNRYWYYNNTEWVCSNTDQLTPGEVYARSNNVWVNTKKGTNVNLVFSVPDNNTHTIQCIDNKQPSISESSETFNATHYPTDATDYPTYTVYPTYLPTIDLTYDSIDVSTMNPTTHSPQTNVPHVPNPTINQQEVLDSHSTTNVFELKRDGSGHIYIVLDGITYIIIGTIILCCVMSLLIAICICYCCWKHRPVEVVNSDTSETKGKTQGKTNKSISLEIPKLPNRKIADRSRTAPKKLIDHDSLKYTPEGMIKMVNKSLEGNAKLNLFATESDMIAQPLPNSPDMDISSINISSGTANSGTQNTFSTGTSIDNIIGAAHLDKIIDRDSAVKIRKIDLALTESEMSDGMYQTPKNSTIQIFYATNQQKLGE